MSALHRLYEDSHHPSVDDTLAGQFDDGTDPDAIIGELLEENESLRQHLEQLLVILDSQDGPEGPSDVAAEGVVELVSTPDRRDHESRPFSQTPSARATVAPAARTASLATERVQHDPARQDQVTPETVRAQVAESSPLLTREQVLNDLKHRFVFSESNLKRVRRLAERIERHL